MTTRPDSCPNCGSREVRSHTGTYCQECGQPLFSAKVKVPPTPQELWDGLEETGDQKAWDFVNAMLGPNAPEREPLVKHEASFVWDEGDRDVGIFPGWGEDTMATTEVGPLRVIWLFVVEDDKPVEQWELDDIQVAWLFDPDGKDFMHIAAGQSTKYEIRRNPRPGATDPFISISYERPQAWRPLHKTETMTLGMFPDVARVVLDKWNEIQAEDRVRAEAERIQAEQQEEAEAAWEEQQRRSNT